MASLRSCESSGSPQYNNYSSQIPCPGTPIPSAIDAIKKPKVHRVRKVLSISSHFAGPISATEKIKKTPIAFGKKSVSVFSPLRIPTYSRELVDPSSVALFRHEWEQDAPAFIRKYQGPQKTDMGSFQIGASLQSDDREAISKLLLFKIGAGEEIIEHRNKYGLQSALSRYFDGVERPEPGDFVVYYYDYRKERYPSAQAIFSGKSQVISIWKWKNLNYLVKHDFFLHPFHGSCLKVYRLRKEGPREIPFPPKHEGDPIVTFIDGKCLFLSTDQNIALRAQSFKSPYLPQVQKQDTVFPTRCHGYALSTILPGFPIRPSRSIQEDLFGPSSKIISTCFTVTDSPQRGDLVIYWNDEGPKHFGIYLEHDLIESKWGDNPVFRHPFFYAPAKYGNKIIFYRKNENAKYSDLILKNCILI